MAPCSRKRPSSATSAVEDGLRRGDVLTYVQGLTELSHGLNIRAEHAFGSVKSKWSPRHVLQHAFAG